jgi:hypothetical protein
MLFQIEGPHGIEAREIVTDEKSLTVTPVLVKGSHIVRVAYCTAVGNGGTEAKAVLLFNANTGQFSIQRIDEQDTTFDFDRPVVEFEKRRALAKATNQSKDKVKNTDDETN